MVYVQPDLQALGDEEFREVTDLYIRGEVDDETRAALEHAPLVRRLASTMDRMLMKVDTQLRARADDVAALEAEREIGGGLSSSQMAQTTADYVRWRSAALRFRGYIEESRSKVADFLEDSRAQELETAIRAHHDAVTSGADKGDADIALWEHLDR